MTNFSHSDYEKIQRLVGAIVLECQAAESTLKVVLPFLNNADDPSLGAAITKIEQLQKRTFGVLADTLVKSTTSDSVHFSQHMEYLVATRNQVVHHFNKTYASKLLSGDIQGVFYSLEDLLTNLKTLRFGLEKIALVISEGLRDVTFKNTPEHGLMIDLCDRLRERLER